MNGRALSEEIYEDLKVELKAFSVAPSLIVILVGNDSASQVYVKNKAKAAQRVGIYSETLMLAAETTEKKLLALIEEYNQNPRWNGILVQLPLPGHIDEKRVLEAIDPMKDVDGFHPYNVGRLATGSPLMIPSTPAGIMRLLSKHKVRLAGKRAVVIGRSNIVGKPVAELLTQADATVTLAHSKTQNLSNLTREADILVVAIGQAKFVTKEMVKEGSVVVDVGMNRDESGKLCGDVEFDGVSQKARLITPVPGGVGPMTIAMLLEQTMRAAKQEKDFY